MQFNATILCPEARPVYPQHLFMSQMEQEETYSQSARSFCPSLSAPCKKDKDDLVLVSNLTTRTSSLASLPISVIYLTPVLSIIHFVDLQLNYSII